MRAHRVEPDLKLIFASVTLENRGLCKAFESVSISGIGLSNRIPPVYLAMMAEACSELIDAGEAKPAEAEARSAIQWYRAHAIPGVQQAVAMERSST